MRNRFAVLTLSLALASAPAEAQYNYSNVYFFGTSEIDAGNWLAHPTLASNPNAPTAARGYWNGRWQSGPAWSDYFAASLGFTSAPSLTGGNNYAFGMGWLGPLAGEIPTPGSLASNSSLWFSSQVTAALTAHASVLSPTALYVISIGSNDPVLFGRTASQAADVANLAVAQIQRLADAGARNFLIQTIGGTSPYVLTYNATLLAGLAAIADIDVSIVDTRTFNQEIVLGTDLLQTLGITDFNTCVADAQCRAAAIEKALAGEPYLGSTHFQFDDIHRDTKVNEALAAYALTRLPQTVVPEPATVSLFALGLLGAGVVARKRRHHRHVTEPTA